MIVYADILEILAGKGWTTYRLIKDRKLGHGTINSIRHKKSITMETLDKLCELCECQPGDLIRYVPDKQGE